MAIKIFQDKDLLDLEFRKQIIEEIEGEENISRKMDALKAYEVYKDQVKKHVLDLLRKEVEPETLVEIEPRTSNISFAKTIVKKKARVYNADVVRESDDPVYVEQLRLLGKQLNLRDNLKKVNAYKELKKNAELYIYPVKDSKSEKWMLKSMALFPHMYDVIEDYYCPEKKRCLIFSYFTNRHQVYPLYNEDGRTLYSTPNDFNEGDGRNQMIADSPADFGEENKLYVVWSEDYHFTMDNKGRIVQPDGTPIESMNEDDMRNDISMIPSVSFNEDQDGQFWAIGGEDVVDGTVLLNVLMTDTNFIAKLHGSGLFYYFGKGVPETVKIGPNRAIVHEVHENDPVPQVGFASANPPLDMHMKNVEQYVGLLLTTNGLTPGAISNKLETNSFSSGVHEMISRSEVLGNVEEEQMYFADKEREVMKVVAAWQNTLFEKQALVEDFQVIGKITDYKNFKTVFNDIKASFTPEQKLAQIEKRREIGLDSLIDSIMIDMDTDDRELAIERAMQILEDKIKFSAMSQFEAPEQPEMQEQESEDED